MPSCLACSKAGACPKGEAPVFAVPEPPPKPKRKRARTVQMWNPNRLTSVPLDCGHLQIPWPLIAGFAGQGMLEVLCTQCGDVWVGMTVTSAEAKTKVREVPVEPLF